MGELPHYRMRAMDDQQAGGEPGRPTALGRGVVGASPTENRDGGPVVVREGSMSERDASTAAADVPHLV